MVLTAPPLEMGDLNVPPTSTYIPHLHASAPQTLVGIPFFASKDLSEPSQIRRDRSSPPAYENPLAPTHTRTQIACSRHRSLRHVVALESLYPIRGLLSHEPDEAIWLATGCFLRGPGTDPVKGEEGAERQSQGTSFESPGDVGRSEGWFNPGEKDGG